MTDKKPAKVKTIYEVLHDIQVNLKAPKGQRNNFGKYNYRNCEDILEAVKPLLPAGYNLVITDEINLIGDRYYVVATVRLKGEKDAIISAQACAREPATRKGMDESQITGAASSYARKYALNGLFCIDDTKDADSGDNKEPATPAKSNAQDKQKFNPITAAEYQGLFNDLSDCKTTNRLYEIQAELTKLKPRMDAEQAKTLGAQMKATQARLDNLDLESNMDKAGGA